MGDRVGAEKLAEPILNDMQGSTPMAVFKVLVALNRAEDGFTHVEQGNHRIFFGGVEVALRPVFDPVRNDPRFLRKLEEAGILSDYREAWAQYLTWKKQTGEP
jgi:hypothetical protein